jgi:hypothetical protein
MTDIATKGGAVIFKDGAAAENCNCCGGWYCPSAVCDSCPSGTSPTLIRAQFTLVAGNGRVSFELPLKRIGTTQGVDAFTGDVLVCDTFKAMWGNTGGLQPDSTYFTVPGSPDPTRLLYTFNGPGIYNGVTIDTNVHGAVVVEFSGRCGATLGLQNYLDRRPVVEAYSTQITFVTGGLLRWAPVRSSRVAYAFNPTASAAYYFTPSYQSQSEGKCYADWPGVSALPISGAHAGYSFGAGTVSLSVNSVE